MHGEHNYHAHRAIFREYNFVFARDLSRPRHQTLLSVVLKSARKVFCRIPHKPDVDFRFHPSYQITGRRLFRRIGILYLYRHRCCYAANQVIRIAADGIGYVINATARRIPQLERHARFSLARHSYGQLEEHASGTFHNLRRATALAVRRKHGQNTPCGLEHAATRRLRDPHVGNHRLLLRDGRPFWSCAIRHGIRCHD